MDLPTIGTVSVANDDLEDGELPEENEQHDNDLLTMSTISSKTLVSSSNESIDSTKLGQRDLKSSDKESEIDRIIEESRRLAESSERSSIISTRPSTSDLTIFTNCSSASLSRAEVSVIFQNKDMTMTAAEGDDPDIVQLRTAALASLKAKSGGEREEGEVSDEHDRATPIPNKIVEMTSTRKRSISGMNKTKEKTMGSPRKERNRDQNCKRKRESNERMRIKRGSSRETSRSQSSRRSRSSVSKVGSETSKNSSRAKKTLLVTERQAESAQTEIREGIKIGHRRRTDSSDGNGPLRSPSMIQVVLGEPEGAPTNSKSSVFRRVSLVPMPPPPPPPREEESDNVLPPPPPPPPMSPTATETMEDVKPDASTLMHSHQSRGNDNYENIGMDLETSGDDSRPPTRVPSSNRQRYISDADENELRNLLLMQLRERNSRAGSSSGSRPESRDAAAATSVLGNGNISEETHLQSSNSSKSKERVPVAKRITREEAIPTSLSNSGLAEQRSSTTRSVFPDVDRVSDLPDSVETYREKCNLLGKMDRFLQTKLHQMESVASERERLMRRIEDLTSSLTSHQTEYWETCNKRDKLRQDVQTYEVERIRRISHASRFAELSSRISLERVRWDEMDARDAGDFQDVNDGMDVHAHEEIIPDQDDSFSPIEQGEPESHDDAVMENSVESVEEAHMEEELQQQNVSLNEDELRRNLLERLKLTRQRKDVVEREEDGFQTQTVQDDVVANEDSPIAIPVGESSTLQPSDSQDTVRGPDDQITPPPNQNDSTSSGNDSQSVAGVSLPVRLLPHSGLPFRPDPAQPICPFELMGKCKDWTCEYRHLADDQLALRDLILMVVQYSPEVAGEELQTANLRQQLDCVLGLRFEDETRERFIQRIIRSLPQSTRNTEPGHAAAEHDQARDYNCYASLQVGTR